MRLNVALTRQRWRSSECGIAVVKMLLDYHGTRRSLAELRRELPVDGAGTYAPQLGSALLRAGLRAEIVTMHPSMFTVRDRGAGPDAVLDRFRRLRAANPRPRHRAILEQFERFVEAGGVVRVQAPDRSDLDAEIHAGRPVGAILTTAFLRARRPRFNLHCILVTGIDETFVHVNDPLWGLAGGRQSHSIADFLFGVHASTNGDPDNGCFIKAIPR